MIVINELRVGNFYYKTGTAEPVQMSVTMLWAILDDKSIVTLADFDPIPIHPELLDHDAVHEQAEYGEFTDCSGRIVMTMKYDKNSNFWDHRIKIDYLHQWQNLWYVLWKEECVTIYSEDHVPHSHQLALAPITWFTNNESMIGKTFYDKDGFGFEIDRFQNTGESTEIYAKDGTKFKWNYQHNDCIYVIVDKKLQ